MTEEEIRRLLDDIPGAKRAADGVIIEGEDGLSFHITGFNKIDADLHPSEQFLTGFCSKHEILRLRDLRTAQDYLLRLRSESIAKSPRAIRTFGRRRAAFEKNGRLWSLTGYYSSINKDAKRYIERLPRKHRKRVASIPYGLAPINEANAVALNSILGDLVLVSENLRYFYYFMNIALYGLSHGIEGVDCTDAATIALRIMLGSESFDFDLDPRGTLPPDIENHLQTLTARQMEFTFGHEFAHLIEGHLTEKTDSVDTRTYAFECEFSADRQAVLLPRTNRKTYQMLALGACDVLLYLHFLECASLRGMLPKFSVSSTHPPALERLRSALDAFEPKVGAYREAVKESIEAVELMAENVERRTKDAERSDILTFYGSMYLAGYTDRLLRDRVDF